MEETARADIAPTNRDFGAILITSFPQKYTSGMTAKTEQTLAERAGHLEMLGGGKKDRGKAGGAKVGGAKAEGRSARGAGGAGKR